ncbi:12830_t:CDS:2 [Entrophospora sp. SA101]|nr:12830_t:CDS:2 [Entrophospora sp. SA101]
MTTNNLLTTFSNKIGQLIQDVDNDDDNEYNTIIRVGDGQDTKLFKAHSLILKAVSPHFRNLFKSENNFMRDGNWNYVEKPYISPLTFEIILKYMYTGSISIRNLDSIKIMEIIETAKEFLLYELVEYLNSNYNTIIKNTEELNSNEKIHTIDNNNNNIRSISGPRSNKKCGRIQLVGAGPGNPHLLTQAACNAIQEADLVLADKLIPEEVLKLVPSDTELIVATRKFCANADAIQEEINQTILQALNNGRHVVRLKQDPFLFGRGGEEFLFFKSHGYIPNVIPGISSCLSAPLYANIPVTHRGVASQLLICTGTGRKNSLPDIPIYNSCRTTVFLMAIHRIKQLITDLINDGKYPPECPCAVIEKASCKDQRVIHGTLATIADIINRAGTNPPGTLVVGWTCLTLSKD